jgi:hypothetical protein
MVIVLYRGKTRPTAVEQIERHLQYAAQAVEKESIVKLSDVFTAEYRDDSGADLAFLLRQAQGFFHDSDEVSVELAGVIHDEPDPPRDAEKARAIVILRISGVTDPGGRRFSGLGGQGQDAFLVRFAKRGGDWKVASTRQLHGTSREELMRELNKQ